MVHYYDEKQTSSYEPILIKIRARNLIFDLYSASGLFSLKELDLGTAALLKYADVKSGKICDLGCGYGVVGIIFLLENKNLEVTFIDINERALKITKKNLEKFDLKGVVKKSNIFENVSPEDGKFDVILTNPPYTAGREVCFEFISQSFDHLNKGGSLQLVARRRKGGDALEEKMKAVFGNVEVLGQKSGFRVYKSVR